MEKLLDYIQNLIANTNKNINIELAGAMLSGKSTLGRKMNTIIANSYYISYDKTEREIFNDHEYYDYDSRSDEILNLCYNKININKYKKVIIYDIFHRTSSKYHRNFIKFINTVHAGLNICITVDIPTSEYKRRLKIRWNNIEGLNPDVKRQQTRINSMKIQQPLIKEGFDIIIKAAYFPDKDDIFVSEIQSD